MGEIKDWRNQPHSYTKDQQQLLNELEIQHKAYLSQLELQKKEASVLGRGIIGGIIAGPAGAVVGALSAIDKNKKNK